MTHKITCGQSMCGY